MKTAPPSAVAQLQSLHAGNGSPDARLAGAARLGAAGGVGLFADLAELCKARLTALVLFTTAAGYALAAPAFLTSEFLIVLGGTGLVAAAASILNQWIEREIDGRMRRTANRPLPCGRLPASAALALGIFVAAAGLGWLIVLSTPLAAATALATLLIYLLAYTPLKRRSAVCTVVGAISGALPPVIGALAAADAHPVAPLFLFSILFLWQIPHFHAIAWLYRADYESAGLVMIPSWDRDGSFTAGSAFAAAVGLGGLPLFAVLAGLQPASLAWVGGALGAGFAVQAWRFFKVRSMGRARALFFASIVYLPLILIAVVALRFF